MVKFGESSAPAFETVGAELYPRLDRKHYGLWAFVMQCAMEGQQIWEAIDPGGDEYVKGGAKYREGSQALMALYSVMPTDMLQHLVGKKSAKDVWGAIKVVCAGVDDTSVHVGQQETVLNAEMTLVESEVTLVGFSSVATPSTATNVSKEVGVNMSSSEKELTSSSEAQPESTRTTNIAGHDVQDREDVVLHDEGNGTEGWPPETVGRPGACILLGIPGGGASRVEPGPREDLGAGGPETPERGGPKESDLPRGASCGDPENRSEDGLGAGDPETPEGDVLKEEGLPEGSPSGGPGASIPEVGAEKTKRPNSVRAIAPHKIDGPKEVGLVRPGLACPENRQ